MHSADNFHFLPDFLGENGYGFGNEIVDEFLALHDLAGRPVGKRNLGGIYPGEDPDVKLFEKEKAQIDHFYRWLRDNPPPPGLESIEAIQGDLNRAILESPDFVKEDAEKILTGAYRSNAMSKSQFDKFQKRCALHKVRNETALANNRGATAALGSSAAQAIHEALSWGPPAARSPYLWTGSMVLMNHQILQPPGTDDADVQSLAKAGAVGLFLLGATYAIYEGCKYAYNRGKELIGEYYESYVEQEAKAGLTPEKADRTRGVAARKDRETRDMSARKAARERDRMLIRDEIALEMSERSNHHIRKRKKVQVPPDIPASREEMRKRDAERLRKNVSDARGEGQFEGDLSLFVEAINQGSYAAMAQAIQAMLDDADTLRQRADAAHQKRYTRYLEGFAAGSVPDPMKWSDSHWD